MASATVTVEVGFGSDPGDDVAATTWTDITAYVKTVDVDRGRRSEFDTFQAGRCRVTLGDTDGRFNPADTSGAYWPDVKPMKRLRVRAEDPDTTTTYTVFSGFVDRWPQEWPRGSEMPVQIEASDGFKLFAGLGLPDSVYAFEVSQDTPENWWRFDETEGTVAVDAGSERRNGTYLGGPDLTVSTLVEHDPGSAAGLDGVDDKMVVVDPQPTSPNDWYEFLLTVDSLPSTRALLVRDRDVVIRLDSSGTIEVFDRTTRSAADTGAFTLSTGTTYHVLVLVDRTLSPIILVDDDAKTSSISYAFGDAVFDQLHVGGPEAQNFYSYDYLAGTIDELARYQGSGGVTILSTARITAHYDAVAAPWNGDTSGERVGRILDLAGWPADDRDVDTGQSTFGDATFVDDQTVLQYLQRCERSESGHLFVTADGQVRFVGRHALLTETVYNTSQVTISDAPGAGEFPPSVVTPNYDDDIVNEVTVQRKFGAAQTVSDGTSETAYLRRTRSETSLLMDDDDEALGRAQWLLSVMSDPRVEVTAVTVEPEFETGLWAHVLGLDLMSRVTVERTPHSGGDTFVQESHIQGVSHRIRPWGGSTSWETSWFLAPADVYDFLVLDDATYGELGANALGY